MEKILSVLQQMEKRFYPDEVRGASNFKQNYKAHRVFYLGLIAIILSTFMGAVYLLLGLGMRALPFLAVFLTSVVAIATFKYRWSRELLAIGVPLATFLTLGGAVFFTDSYFGLFGLIYIPALSYIMGKRFLSLIYLMLVGASFFFITLPDWPQNPLAEIINLFGAMPYRRALTFIVTMVVVFFFILTLDVAAEYAFQLLQSEINKRQETTRRLAEANQTKDQLMSVIGHDLVSPVNQVKMLLEMGKAKGACEDDETLKLADESADRAITLMRNLTDWARTHWENLQPKPVMVHPRIVADTVMESFRLQYQEKGVEILNRMDEHLELETDTDLLTTILRNLVANALKFTHTGGSVTLTSAAESQGVILGVEDTGVGIPPERIEKIFQADHSKVRRGTRKEPGSGLGLILCQDFASRMGGALEVESLVDKGSRFLIRLPWKIQAMPAV